MPCREFLSQLLQAYPGIEAMRAAALAVGTGSHDQARALMEAGNPFPCLVDPTSNLYRALDIRRLKLWEFLRPSGLRRYTAAFRHGARQGRITGDWRQLPGVLLLDARCVPRYVHRGGVLGDYPPLAEVMGRLRELCRTTS